MLILLAGSVDDTNDCAFSDTCVSLFNLGNITLQSLCYLAYASIVWSHVHVNYQAFRATVQVLITIRAGNELAQRSKWSKTSSRPTR